MLKKQKQKSITSQKLDLRNFWQIGNSVPNKAKSVVPSVYDGPEVLSSAYGKAKLLKTLVNL